MNKDIISIMEKTCRKDIVIEEEYLNDSLHYKTETYVKPKLMMVWFCNLL